MHFKHNLLKCKKNECNVRWTSNLNLSLTLVDVKLVGFRTRAWQFFREIKKLHCRQCLIWPIEDLEVTESWASSANILIHAPGIYIASRASRATCCPSVKGPPPHIVTSCLHIVILGAIRLWILLGKVQPAEKYFGISLFLVLPI